MYFQQFEDQYNATVLDNFQELRRDFATFCESPGLAHLNVPIWIDYDAADDSERGTPHVTLGLLLTRHGHPTQWIAPASPDEVQELRSRMLRIWAGRADTGFERYYWTPELLQMQK